MVFWTALLASSYLHVQLSKKSQLYTNQLLLSQYLAKCNTVWGRFHLPPPNRLEALPSLLFANALRLSVKAYFFVYGMRNSQRN